ncbi:hypothetical protein H6G89_06665 [Oscillatoria sp. FACHB-1407]|uniref:hypothetical protein n=1 Tax=Oscillatoria sp. FACHB-1407 TaxID=2692847 RepID=UPI001687C9A1|nr:hypothetical protein [Oscillatoria sp. FACHB-1407]MBD2460722.1 hypothetical protein [Oscillatoria sp. FACHB-1407]
MGYSAMFSIGLGAIAGFAGGFISAYVKAKAQVPPPPPSQDDNESPLKRAQNRIQKWRKDGEDSRKQASNLGRNRRRSLKSSRRSP